MLRDLAVETVSNLIWVGLVFAVLALRDRRKRAQLDRCLEAYLIYILESAQLVKNSVYPYLYLIRQKATQGRILPEILGNLQGLADQILSQTQDQLGRLDSARVSEKILALYQLVILFKADVSRSQLAVDPIVGNPTDLVEPPRADAEIERFATFVERYIQGVRATFEAAPAGRRSAVPASIVAALEQPSPLEQEFQATRQRPRPREA